MHFLPHRCFDKKGILNKDKHYVSLHLYILNLSWCQTHLDIQYTDRLDNECSLSCITIGMDMLKMILFTNFISIVLVIMKKRNHSTKTYSHDLFPNLICWRKIITLKFSNCITNLVVKYWPIFASVLRLKRWWWFIN